MIHAFRLGPVPASAPPIFAYAVLLPGGDLEVALAPGDEQGLTALRAAVQGQALACEPALADAGRRLRLVVAPLPPEALQARALLACELTSGIDHGVAPLPVVASYVKAAGAFWSSRLWELIVPGEPLHVGYELGAGPRQGLLALEASDRSQPKLVFSDDPGLLARLRGLPGEEAIAELGQGDGLGIELAEAPAWAVAALEEGAQLARVPRLTRRRAGSRTPADARDLAMGAALLAGMVAFADLGAVGDADVEVEAGTIRVKARIGTTTPAPPAPAGSSEAAPQAPEPVDEAPAGDVPADDEPLPAPEPAAEPVPEPAPAEDDGPLTPEELAAATPPPAPAPAPALAAEPEPAPAPAAAPAPVPTAQLAPVLPAEAAPVPAADGPVGKEGEGWLAKAWRALGGSRKPKESPAVATPMAAATRPAAAPVAKLAAPARRAAPPPVAPPEPGGPFAPFARALRIGVPAEPPAAPLAEREASAALAQRLIAGAVGGERFVSFPAVALQIIELVHGPDADARGVAGFISRDPGLAADVLAVANSAAFRGVSEVGSVREAVARLGLQEVGRVASAVSARALLLPARAGGGAPTTALFTRAVAVATAASATALRLRGAHSDQAWLAGLLHDVGIALAASAMDRLGAEGGAGVTRSVAERAVELAHVEVGAAALKAWALPAYLAEVCARHHDEEVPAGPEHVDLHLVRLTSALARLGEPEVGARAAREVVQSARALGFDAHAVRALAADLKAAEGRAAVLVR